MAAKAPEPNHHHHHHRDVDEAKRKPAHQHQPPASQKRTSFSLYFVRSAWLVVLIPTHDIDPEFDAGPLVICPPVDVVVCRDPYGVHSAPTGEPFLFRPCRRKCESLAVQKRQSPSRSGSIITALRSSVLSGGRGLPSKVVGLLMLSELFYDGATSANPVFKCADSGEIPRNVSGIICCW